MPRDARPLRTTAPERPAASPQLELFPEPVLIEALDTRKVSGARTRVRGVWRVRFGSEPRAHRVYHDRHGWYCDEHGAGCRAAHTVRAAEGAPPAPEPAAARRRR
jgi:hypothetical protein